MNKVMNNTLFDIEIDIQFCAHIFAGDVSADGVLWFCHE